MSTLDLKDPKLFRQQCYINGEWADADSGETIDVDNPATGEVIGTVPKMGQKEARRAIEGALEGFKVWRNKTAGERAEVLYTWWRLMMDNQEDLGRIMTLEQGKPLKEAKGEIAYAASFIPWFAEEARRAYGDTIPGAKPGQQIVVIKQPCGVTAAITPWNFPASMITRKAGAALAAGCPMVVKPASATPYSALALAELAERAGVPEGCAQHHHRLGRRAWARSSPPTTWYARSALPAPPSVGSTLMAQCAEHIQKVSLELGGNAPFLVFDDADMDKAVEGAMASKFRNTGQTCVCVNRFLVQESVHDEFVEKMKKAIEKLKVGDGFEEGVDQGPLINKGAVEKVQEHLRDALDKGAELIIGGKPHARGGNFFQPTLITGVKPDMKLCDEETFGPLASIMTFKTEQEGIDKANDTPYGLASYFYSRECAPLLARVPRRWRPASSASTKA